MSNRGIDYFSPSNPDAPYFQLKIQESLFDIDINFIESLTIDRSTYQSGDLTFTMVNVNDPLLERKFCELIGTDGDEDSTNISFQYGWNKGPKSKWYSGRIWNYTPTYTAGGYVKLDVKCKILASGEDMVPQVKTYIGTSASNIIEKISEDMGWVIEELEQSKPFAIPQHFTVSNVDVVKFIRDKLTPNAVNKNNEPFSFYLDSYNGQDHVYFVSVNKSVVTQKNYNFFVYMGNYGSVLSWSPSYEGVQIAQRVIEAPIFNSETNDITLCSAKGAKGLKNGPILTAYGSTSPDNMEALIANKWFHENIGSIKATMEIVGDPTLMPQQKINVMPMTANGEPHLSAGTYIIDHITDTISGTFTSSLQLHQLGVDDGSGLTTMPMSEVVQLKESE